MIHDVFAENEMLRERVRFLQAALAPQMAFPSRWGLTPSEATILRVLMAREVATHKAIIAALYGYDRDGASTRDTIKVFVWSIRQSLPAEISHEVKTLPRVGYALSAAGKRLVKKVCTSGKPVDALSITGKRIHSIESGPGDAATSAPALVETLAEGGI